MHLLTHTHRTVTYTLIIQKLYFRHVTTFGQGNGCPIATNVVLVLVLVFVSRGLLKPFHFTTDRRQTSHTDWRQHFLYSRTVPDF